MIMQSTYNIEPSRHFGAAEAAAHIAEIMNDDADRRIAFIGKQSPLNFAGEGARLIMIRQTTPDAPHTLHHTLTGSTLKLS
jgi:hypothetical protein